MKSGIVSYGAYIPRYRIRPKDIGTVWGADGEAMGRGLNIRAKSVPGPDEDVITISVEAARACMAKVDIDPTEIGAIYVGSESHPYAVKPTATIVAEAIGSAPVLTAADFEFACKAGTAAIQTTMGLTLSKMMKYGLAIGSDTSQGAPGDALEYSASAGGAALLIGTDRAVADISHTVSYTTDTPDFWRREGQRYPSHGGRFTGEPAYFKHVVNCAQLLFKRAGTTAEDYDYAVFHQPNGKFPVREAWVDAGRRGNRGRRDGVGGAVGSLLPGPRDRGRAEGDPGCEAPLRGHRRGVHRQHVRGQVHRPGARVGPRRRLCGPRGHASPDGPRRGRRRMWRDRSLPGPTRHRLRHVRHRRRGRGGEDDGCRRGSGRGDPVVHGGPGVGDRFRGDVRRPVRDDGAPTHVRVRHDAGADGRGRGEESQERRLESRGPVPEGDHARDGPAGPLGRGAARVVRLRAALRRSRGGRPLRNAESPQVHRHADSHRGLRPGE